MAEDDDDTYTHMLDGHAVRQANTEVIVLIMLV